MERVIKEMKIKSKKRRHNDEGPSGFQHQRKKRMRLDNEMTKSMRKEPERRWDAADVQYADDEREQEEKKT